MITIKLSDGAIFTGADEHEILRQLKMDDWTSYPSQADYKTNIARRVKVFKGEVLEFSSDLEFLSELVRVGFISEINYKAEV